jgi:hypothetical protein
MSGSPQNSVDPSKLSTVNILVHQLGLLLTGLVSASRATADAVKLSQIANEATAVQTLIGQATQAQTAADNTQFGQITLSLKSQATVLQGMAAQITAIVADVALAGQIVGYITQALSLIAAL